MRIPVRVDVMGAVSGFDKTLGRVTGVVLVVVTFASSSVSDSSSELVSSSEDSDSSFLAAGAVEVGVVDPDWRNRL